MKIGVVSPGAMGSALGRAWAAAGLEVSTTVAGRSARTRALASGLSWRPDLDSLVADVDLIVSVVPPDRARPAATAVRDAGARVGATPVFADLNAIAPTTVRALADDLAGWDVIDGSISGGPPQADQRTTLFLSGPRAELLDVEAPGLHPRILGPQIGAASAVKMCTASIFKGYSALLMHALLTADVNGVLDPVVEELGADDAARRLAMAASKAWRYVGEMHEISATQAAAGLTPALFDAVAAVFTAAAGSDLAAVTPEQAMTLTDLNAIIADLVAGWTP